MNEKKERVKEKEKREELLYMKHALEAKLYYIHNSGVIDFHELKRVLSQ